MSYLMVSTYLRSLKATPTARLLIARITGADPRTIVNALKQPYTPFNNASTAP